MDLALYSVGNDLIDAGGLKTDSSRKQLDIELDIAFSINF